MEECLCSMVEALHSIPSIVKQQKKALIKVIAGGTMGHLLNHLQVFLFSKNMNYSYLMRSVFLTFPKSGQPNLIFLLLLTCFNYSIFDFLL